MSTFERPPRPRGMIIVGNVPQLRRNPLRFMTDCARRLGDVVHLRLAVAEGYLLSHPDLIEEVLVTSNRKFIKPFLLKEASEVLGNGLLTSDGDTWLRQRRLIAPAFHRDRIAAYGTTMVECTDRMLRQWRAGEVRDVHDEMMRLTLAIVSRTLFGVDVDEQAAEIGAALEVAIQRFADRMSPIRFLDRLPIPRNRRFARARKRLDAVIYGIIEHRRGAPAADGDVLSLLLRARDEDGTMMSDLQVHDEAITLFLAGHETTAIALTWAWYLLALNPGVRERLDGELASVLGGRHPEVADLPQLAYCEMVVKEAMRLYPPAWRIGREATETCEIGGWTIPAGAQVIMSQWVVHRDPRFFEDPEAFRPERWASDGRDRPKFSYFPFGGGARRCIGDSFAMMEATLLLATVARSFRLELEPGQEIVLWPSITLRPKHGLRVRLSAC